MDRINGADFTDIGNGKRGFQDQNAVAGVAGTEVTADFLNSVQEEILTVIEKAGLKADSKNWAQLWEALNQLNLPGFRGRHFWHAVKAIDVSSPPTNASAGDAYLIPSNATGAWAAQKNKIAIKDEASWIYISSQDGHGIGLPDGRVFTKVDGSYIEKIALDSQSGKWNYAVAGGTANALTATLDPAPLVLTVGMAIQLKISATNTGDATLNVNGLGAKSIVYHETWESLVGGDLQNGDVTSLIFDGIYWRLQPSLAYMDKRYSRLVPPPTDTFYVNATTGNDSNNGFSTTTAFKSLQGAVNAINSRYMTVGKITVRVAAGKYQGFVLTNSYVTDWDFIGDATNPENVKIDASTVASARRGILLANVNVTINGFAILSYWDGINANINSDVTVRNCYFRMYGTATAYGISTFSGSIKLYGNITFAGNCISTLFNSGGVLAIGYTDGIITENVKITYTNDVICSAANLISENGGLTTLSPSVITFIGNPNTPKFIAAVNGIIRAYGAGINFLPGTQAGVIATGGQYV